MIRLNKILFCTAVLLITATSAHAELKRDAAYADYLFSRGYYSDSRSEYLFLSYSAKTSAEKDMYQYKASKSLLESGNFINAEKELYMMFTAGETASEVKKAARFDYLRSLYFQKNYFRIENDCGSRSDKTPRDEMVLLWAYIAEGNWNGAESLCSRMSENKETFSGFSTDEAEQFRQASLTVTQRPDFNIKSPVLAASLSAVLPGAGHIYAGSFPNAIG